MYKNVKHHYFSIDAIMAGQEKIPCRFTRNIDSVGKSFVKISRVIQRLLNFEFL